MMTSIFSSRGRSGLPLWSSRGRLSACAAISFQCVAKKDGRLDRPADLPSGPTTWFMGGCVLFHVPSVLKVGGYRPWWVYGYEEPELALRLYGAGFGLWYDASILIEHNQFYNPSERRDFCRVRLSICPERCFVDLHELSFVVRTAPGYRPLRASRLPVPPPCRQ
jgi:hypothetical protein